MAPSVCSARPLVYLVEIRVQAARSMMKADGHSLACIALDYGFSHQSHMGAAFRKHLGLTPSQYLARIRHPDEKKASKDLCME